MYTKKSALLAAVVLFAGAPVARAHHDAVGRDVGNSAYQTELDEQYARSHPTVMPGTPARPISAYGYVPPHRPAAKHRNGIC